MRDASLDGFYPSLYINNFSSYRLIIIFLGIMSRRFGFLEDLDEELVKVSEFVIYEWDMVGNRFSSLLISGGPFSVQCLNP